MLLLQREIVMDYYIAQIAIAKISFRVAIEFQRYTIASARTECMFA